MSILPPLCDVLESSANPDDALAKALSILFEPTPILFSKLVPQVITSLSKYSSIITPLIIIRISIAIIDSWDDNLKSQFIAGHPRIGENKNLSNLSSKEQGVGVHTTSPEILARLSHLNACYERRFPGLRYITFVNGRNRAAIVEEMEDCLGIEHSWSSIEPHIDRFEPVDAKDIAWKAELNRAIIDVGRIAESRLGAFGIE